MSYIFHPVAETEYLQATAYYEDIKPGLGASYLNEFELTIQYICKAPHRHKVVVADIHKVRMKKFPYYILYRENNNTVQVLAVAHLRRKPGYWLNRL